MILWVSMSDLMKGLWLQKTCMKVSRFQRENFILDNQKNRLCRKYTWFFSETKLLKIEFSGFVQNKVHEGDQQQP